MVQRVYSFNDKLVRVWQRLGCEGKDRAGEGKDRTKAALNLLTQIKRSAPHVYLIPNTDEAEKELLSGAGKKAFRIWLEKK